MTEFYSDPLVTLLHGDCIEVMATLPADSVDAVVTDPPYGLEFMGKEWDRFLPESAARGRWKAPASAGHGIGKVDPTANGLAAHRVSYHSRRETSRCRQCGKRDAFRTEHGHGDQWETVWVDEKPLESQAFQAWCEQWGREALRVTKPGGYLLAFGGTRTHHRLVCALEDAGWIIRDELDWIYASGFPKGKANLKPAHEPIVLARKPGPLRPLAIDESRIPGQWTTKRQRADGTAHPGNQPFYPGTGPDEGMSVENASGRWPSNVLLSDPELFDEPNSYVVGSGATASLNPEGVFGRDENASRNLAYGYAERDVFGYGDSGGYSRFFIVPKADRAERERGLVGADGTRIYGGGKGNNTRRCRQCGSRTFSPQVWPACGHEDYEWVDKLPIARANVHPTVKPIDLMRHLVRLVTPAGGVVLDPFLGSGTTCLAASELGVRSIGIEREAEYLEIAKGRLIATPMGLGLEVI